MYRIVLYWTTSGRVPVREFIDGLPENDQGRVLGALDHLAEEGPALRRPYAAHVRGKLWELRVSLGRNEHRLLYFFVKGQTVIMVHGFRKKTDAIPVREIRLAEMRQRDYEVRLWRGEVGP